MTIYGRPSVPARSLLETAPTRLCPSVTIKNYMTSGEVGSMTFGKTSATHCLRRDGGQEQRSVNGNDYRGHVMKSKTLVLVMAGMSSLPFGLTAMAACWDLPPLMPGEGTDWVHNLGGTHSIGYCDISLTGTVRTLVESAGQISKPTPLRSTSTTRNLVAHQTHRRSTCSSNWTPNLYRAKGRRLRLRNKRKTPLGWDSDYLKNE